jgi:hypothetical protein
MLWVSGTELTRGMPSLNPEPCGRACLSCIWCTTDRVTWYTWYTDRVRHGIHMDLHATARRKRPAAPLVEYWSCEHVRAVERAVCERHSVV